MAVGQTRDGVAGWVSVENAPDAIVDDVGFRVARGAVSLSKIADGGQGWSEHADRQRAKLDGPLPVGWTPLK